MNPSHYVKTAVVGGWGLWDCTKRVWLGNEKGPQTYGPGEINGKPVDGPEMARIAAAIVNERCGYSLRVIARIYIGGADRMVGETIPKITAKQAIKQIETRK